MLFHLKICFVQTHNPHLNSNPLPVQTRGTAAIQHRHLGNRVSTFTINVLLRRPRITSTRQSVLSFGAGSWTLGRCFGWSWVQTCKGCQTRPRRKSALCRGLWRCTPARPGQPRQCRWSRRSHLDHKKGQRITHLTCVCHIKHSMTPYCGGSGYNYIKYTWKYHVYNAQSV